MIAALPSIADQVRNASACAAQARAEKVRAKLPALVTVTAEINTPRYPTPINIMKALKKPRAVWNAQDLGADTAQTGIPGSPSSTKIVFEPPKRNTDTTYFTGSAEEIAQLAVYLASDAAAYTTGGVHLIDGGMSL